MIEFYHKNDFQLPNFERYKTWIMAIIQSEDLTCGDVFYTFCDDAFLDRLNQEYLNHKDFTDIITFDSSIGNIVSGDVFISTERVAENAAKYDVLFYEELRRVMAHGLLHLFGYGDESKSEQVMMRRKEEEKMNMFHVEQNDKE